MDDGKGPFSPQWDAKLGESRHKETEKEVVGSGGKKSGKKSVRVNSGPAADYQKAPSTRGSARKAAKAD